MSIQEIEEAEFRPASELENCLFEARVAFEAACAPHRERIAALVARDRFVVVRMDEYHCRATDALVGVVEVPVADFDTRGRAEADAKARSSGVESWDDARFEVRPVLREPVVNVPDEEGADVVPF